MARGTKTGEGAERNDGELSAPGGKETRVLRKDGESVFASLCARLRSCDGRCVDFVAMYCGINSDGLYSGQSILDE